MLSYALACDWGSIADLFTSFFVRNNSAKLRIDPSIRNLERLYCPE
jgi:hypothetical protein